jgi:hypothetical protein
VADKVAGMSGGTQSKLRVKYQFENGVEILDNIRFPLSPPPTTTTLPCRIRR